MIKSREGHLLSLTAAFVLAALARCLLKPEVYIGKWPTPRLKFTWVETDGAFQYSWKSGLSRACPEQLVSQERSRRRM